MADLLFKCRHCSKHLVIDGAASGKMLKCVDCGQPIRVPRLARAFKCPTCSCELSIPPADEGEQFHCPACKAALVVPTTLTTRLPVRRTECWNTSPDGAN